MTLKKDLTGMVFGELTCLRVVSKTRNGHIRWECKCSCGKLHESVSTHLIQMKITHCGCQKKQGISHGQWTGCGNISGDVFYAIRKGAAKGPSRATLEFNLTIEQLWELFEKQDRKCALSGVPLHFNHEGGQRVNKRRTASLDRIDSSKGYVIDNVQWVHKDINLMKNRLDQNYFIEMCHNVHFANTQ